jgi:hypothetical protein
VGGEAEAKVQGFSTQIMLIELNSHKRRTFEASKDEESKHSRFSPFHFVSASEASIVIVISNRLLEGITLPLPLPS